MKLKLLNTYVNNLLILFVTLIACPQFHFLFYPLLLLFLFSETSSVNTKSFLSTWLPLIIYVSTLILSLSYSSDFRCGLRQFEKLVPFVIAIIMALFIKQERKVSIDAIGKYYSIGISFVLLVGIVGVIFQLLFGQLRGTATLYGITSVNFLEVIAHRSYIGIAVLMAFPYWYSNLNISRDKYQIITSLLLLFLSSVLILFSGARAVILSCMALHIYFMVVLLQKTVRKHQLWLIIISLVAVGVFLVLTNYRFHRLLVLLFNGNKDAVADPRITIWSSAINVLKDNWLLGFGIGDAKSELLKHYRNIGFSLGYSNELNAHNQYLESLLGGGIVALVALLGTIVSFVRYHRTKRKYAIGLIIIFGINLFFESAFVRNIGTIPFAFWMLVLYVTSNDEICDTPKRVEKASAYLGTLALVLLLGIGFATFQYKFISDNPSSYMQNPYDIVNDTINGEEIEAVKVNSKDMEFVNIRKGARALIPFKQIKDTSKMTYGVWVKIPSNSKISMMRLFVDELGKETVWREYNQKGKWEYLELNDVKVINRASFGVRIDYEDYPNSRIKGLKDVFYISNPTVKIVQDK